MAWMGGADGVGVVTGRRGVACRVGVTWQVGSGGGLGVAVIQRVAGCCVPCQGGAGVGWRGRMEVARMHEWAAISRVLRRVGAARWVGSGGVSEQDGGGSHARMAVLHAVLGRQVGGGSMLRAMSGRRVRAGTNGSGSHARGGGNGLQHSG
ncbi:hypothetical protein EDB89DRAFT_1915155 [Lactarius sanguifluus]|nr:hypothetical protein EDB89DRAFT_1915155 [Lactarius sanguifluus]